LADLQWLILDMDLIKQLKDTAITLNKKIVLPEGNVRRILLATETILKENIAEIVLLGSPDEINSIADQKGINIEGAEIVDPSNSPLREKYAEAMVEIRKSKGLTKDEALKQLDDSLYFASMMVKMGDADGEVAGAKNSTGNVLRPAFQYVKTLPGISLVSGAYIMVLKDKSFGHDGVLVFADCAAMPVPNEQQLAEIAVTTARTANSLLGFEPRVAMLSFSTKGSASHELVDKVRNATEAARKMNPELKIDGEMQVDAALVPEVARLKAPDSEVAGKANVLVFPNLGAGNIGYKLVQRLAGAEALGPILQGMAAPINDLSRGCSASDVVNLVAITVNQANQRYSSIK
jgi:phosphate acetyltransferase